MSGSVPSSNVTLMMSWPLLAAGGLVVQHAVESDELFFDRLRDGLLQILRIAAKIVGGDLHLTAELPADRWRSAGRESRRRRE